MGDKLTEGIALFRDWSIDSILVDWVDKNTSRKLAGRFVGGNTHLKKLAIRD